MKKVEINKKIDCMKNPLLVFGKHTKLVLGERSHHHLSYYLKINTEILGTKNQVEIT